MLCQNSPAGSSLKNKRLKVINDSNPMDFRTHSGVMVSTQDYRSQDLGSSLAEVTMLFSWRRHLTLTVPPMIQVYECRARKNCRPVVWGNWILFLGK